MEDHEEFMEEEIWANNFMKEREVVVSSSLRAQRLIPRARENWEVNKYRSDHQSSAPVKIPDWPNKKQKFNRAGDEYDDAWADNYNGNGGKRLMYFGHDDDEEDSNEMIPPHEFIARRLARRRIVSFSMCEGIGRTLKGRDLSKVRNAILSKTGFLE